MIGDAYVEAIIEAAERDASIARVLREICALDGAVRAGALELVGAHLRTHAALRAKAEIGLVSEVMGAASWVHGPGDDGAVVRMGAAGGDADEKEQRRRRPHAPHGPPLLGAPSLASRASPLRNPKRLELVTPRIGGVRCEQHVCACSLS